MRILHLSEDGLPDSRVEKSAISALNRGHEVSFGGKESKNYTGKTFSKIFAVNWTAKARMGIPFYWQSVKKQIGKVIREVKPDLVHAHNIFSAKMASEIKIPFIYDDHEYWSKHSMLLPEMSRAAWGKKPKQDVRQLFGLYFRIKTTLRDKHIIRVWSQWEKEIVSNHPTITVSEKIAEEHRIIGNNTNTVFVVQNFPAWFEVSDLRTPLFHDQLSSVYAGGDGRNTEKFPNRNIEGLVDIFAQEEIGNLAILGWEDQSSSEKIRYFGLLPRRRMYEEMHKHSIGLLPWKKHWSHYFVNPNKTYEYAHAGLFVLCTYDIQTVSETLKENCAVFEDYHELVSQLKYYNENLDDLYKKRLNTFEFARRHLIWEENEKNIFRAYQMC